MAARSRTPNAEAPNALVIGLDLSLTGTGWATFNSKEVAYGTLSPPKHRSGMPRIAWMLRSIFRIIDGNGHKPVLVAIEGLAFAARDRNLERAGLAFLVRYKLWRREVPYVLVAPMSLKKFTAGSGKAKKSKMMLHVYQRWKFDTDNDNEADAVSLLQIARALTGSLTPETKAQHSVLNKLRERVGGNKEE